MAITSNLAFLNTLFTVKKLTVYLCILTAACLLGSIASYKRINEINAFNIAVSTGKPPTTDQQSFEAKYATALYLAKKERYKEATLLFTQLLPKGNLA